MMKRYWKQIIAVFVVCLLTIGTIPALAAPGDTLDSLAGAQLLEGTPTSYQFLRHNTEGSVTKQVDETGFYQRLPRNTMLCTRCGNVAVELAPEYYSVPTSGSYTLSDPSVIGDCSFSLEYSQFAGYTNIPCLQFNYTAKNPGTTTVTLTFTTIITIVGK